MDQEYGQKGYGSKQSEYLTELLPPRAEEQWEREPLKVQQRIKVFGPVTAYNGYENYSGDD